MADILSSPTGMGIQGSNCITFASGIGVTNPVSTQITWAQVVEFAKNPQCVEKKKANWILPNDSLARKRSEAERSNFGLTWADIDEPSHGGIDAIVDVLRPATPFLIYATKSATLVNPRYRVLVPLLKVLDFDSWLHWQNKLNEKLEDDGICADSCNLNPAQILFLPNRGEYYAYRRHKGFYAAKEVRQPPTTASINPIQPRTAPDRGGVIDRFKAAYSLADILRAAGYTQNPHNPLQWRHPRSDSGSYSASISPETGRIHSLSSRDPLYTGGGGVGAHDAFGAFQVLFCDGDMRKAVWRAANEWLAKEAAHG